ncbi:MAG: DUF2279 domain-containing protein [Alphaproteobacteria bacterium]|nr:DUF2279 domain-containing protein [Alphaproteobacteria bacterium]
MSALLRSAGALGAACLLVASHAGPAGAGEAAYDIDFSLHAPQPYAANPDRDAPYGPSLAAADTAADESTGREPEPDGWLTKERKVLLLNGGAVAAIAIYGVINWDYFQGSAKSTPEGWFGRTTKSGGADKMGHLWSTYAASHLLAYLYRDWGYSDSEANGLGALSALGVQTMMELGDAYSGDFGFSYEDMAMNVAGAGAAYALGRYPALKSKLDLRVEYKPDRFGDLAGDIFTDYENQRYLLALKLDGFDVFEDSHLGYLELHVGYFTRGYDSFPQGGSDDRRRSLYVGVGVNVTKLVRMFADTAVFNYIQIPYTSIRADRDLD